MPHLQVFFFGLHIWLIICQSNECLQHWRIREPLLFTVSQVVHRWICIYGVMDMMDIRQSDNGSQFKGECLAPATNFGARVINERPRTPRTQKAWSNNPMVM